MCCFAMFLSMRMSAINEKKVQCQFESTMHANNSAAFNGKMLNLKIHRLKEYQKYTEKQSRINILNAI